MGFERYDYIGDFSLDFCCGYSEASLYVVVSVRCSIHCCM